MITPEKYVFLGDNSPEPVEAFTRDVLQKPVIPSGEIAHTPELTACLADMISAVRDYCLSLGIDVVNRLPTESNFHFYPEAVWPEVRKPYQKADWTGAFNSYEGNAFVCWRSRGGDIFQDSLLYANHELVHLVSYCAITLELRETIVEAKEIQVGYRPTSGINFRTFSECVTEEISLEVVDGFWVMFPRLQWGSKEYYHGAGIGRLQFLLALAQRTHERGYRPGVVLKLLYKGLFLGTIEGLEALKNTLGEEKFEILKTMDPHSEQEAREIARQLGLLELADKDGAFLL